MRSIKAKLKRKDAIVAELSTHPSACNELLKQYHSTGNEIGDVLTPQAAGELLGVSERHIRRLCKKGVMKGAYKAGRSWLIPMDSVDFVSDRKYLL